MDAMALYRLEKFYFEINVDSPNHLFLEFVNVYKISLHKICFCQLIIFTLTHKKKEVCHDN